jgi:formimidoylglutamate deiminase
MSRHNIGVKLESAMNEIWAKTALLPSGWAEDVTVRFDENGVITSVEEGQSTTGSRVNVLLPAPVNAHSHAFQRAMAGMTEMRGPKEGDSFWTWRDLMYRFLDRLTPEHVEAIAALVQMEMLEAGYATNVEFHYLHHQPGGQPYATLSEMAERIMAAAETTGIGLTLLPVQYEFGGCDKRELGPGQVRFGNKPERFLRLLEECRATLSHLPEDAELGVAPHSLRAVSPEDIRQVPHLAGDGPVHMHIAEQVAEVEEVHHAYGARPVEWAIENLPLGPKWCLIHCTQMTPEETVSLAKTGAVAGLCPITEASLGDGIFDGVRWFDSGGRIAVGSDSNIRISLSEELRSLEYSQRLRDKSRATLATDNKSTGRALFDAICAGGAQAAGRNTGAIAQGHLADLMALNSESIVLEGHRGDTLLDAFVFAGSDSLVSDVWSAGRHMVKGGRHIHRDIIIRAYRKAIEPLRAVI